MIAKALLEEFGGCVEGFATDGFCVTDMVEQGWVRNWNRTVVVGGCEADSTQYAASRSGHGLGARISDSLEDAVYCQALKTWVRSAPM